MGKAVAFPLTSKICFFIKKKKASGKAEQAYYTISVTITQVQLYRYYTISVPISQ